MLAVCYRIHHDPDEVPTIPAFLQNARRQVVGIKPRAAEPLAAKPGLENFLAIRAVLHGAESWNQSLINRQITAVNRKSAGRKQHVIKQIRPGSMAAHHEDRSIFAIAEAGRLHTKILPRRVASAA